MTQTFKCALFFSLSVALAFGQRAERPRRPSTTRVTRSARNLAIPITSAVPARPQRPSRPPEATGRYITHDVGLFVQIERRGWPAMYSNGELFRNWNAYDPIVDSTYGQEAALQLGKMRAMGVNTIMLEVRTADPDYAGFEAFPYCKVNYVLGPEWPVPTSDDLAGLRSYLDLAQSLGMKVWLDLNNTHMDEDPELHSKSWVNAILSTVKDHPALDLIMFGGDLRVLDLDADGIADHCGGQSEAPLWLGATSTQAKYVAWAIGYGISLGIDPHLLSAEAIIGDYNLDSELPAGPAATDGHLWPTVTVMKSIFDQLQIPSDRRTYALSFYEHEKCLNIPSWWTCSSDVDVYTWTEQTLQTTMQTISADPGARVVAVEFGRFNGASLAPTENAVEHMVELFRKYNVNGGDFWRWANYNNNEDSDPTLSAPVKQRGVEFNYNSVENEIVDWGGFHLTNVPNGSFEIDANADDKPDEWNLVGNASRYLLTAEIGQPEVPTRGVYALRLIAKAGGKSFATSSLIPVSAETLYTTTLNLRFGFAGDPDPTAPASNRPQVYVAFNYFSATGVPSAQRPSDVFRFFQEDSTTGFATFPLRYKSPRDAQFVQIEIGAIRNGLPGDIVVDADNVR